MIIFVMRKGGLNVLFQCGSKRPVCALVKSIQSASLNERPMGELYFETIPLQYSGFPMGSNSEIDTGCGFRFNVCIAFSH